MFTRALPFVVSFLVTFTSALPGIAGYQRSSSSCQYPNQANFRLTAEYTSPGGGSSKPILSLVRSPNNQTTAWIGATDTNSTGPIVISQNFDMYEGGIIAMTSNKVMTGVSKAVETNGVLGFMAFTTQFAPEPVENVYCVVDNTNKDTSGVYKFALTTNGQLNSFSLCQRTGGNDFALIYEANGEDITVGEYQFGNCNDAMVYVDPQ